MPSAKPLNSNWVVKPFMGQDATTFPPTLTNSKKARGALDEPWETLIDSDAGLG